MYKIRRLVVTALLLPPAFELTVRFEDWARFGVPMDSRVTMLEDLSVTDSAGQHARAGMTFKQFHINSLGFRGAEVADSVLRSEPLIITSGASETFGLYESPEHEWPRQLADSLDRRCASHPVLVLNAAFAGMALPTVIQDVALRLRPLRPKIIIYYPTPSQYLYAETPKPSPRSYQRPRAFSPWRSRALPRLRAGLKSAIPEPVLEILRRVDTERLRVGGDTLFSTLPVSRLDSLELHLRVLVGTVRQGGSALVLVMPQNRFADTTSVTERRWLRAWEHMVPTARGSLLMSFSDLARTRIRAVAADSGVPIVDPALTARREHASLFGDYLHLTDRGAAIFAGSVSRSLGTMLGCAVVSAAATRVE